MLFRSEDVAHCVACNNEYVIDPQVFGLVNCFSPRTYNLIIRSVSPTVISGHYKIYADNPLEGNIMGTFGPEDTLVDEHDYQTTLGTYNQYLATNMGYEPYSYTKPTSERNLWALVQTDESSNKVLGYLINSCAPLSTVLRSFEVSYSNNKVVLNWDINPEAGVTETVIERRFDNNQFDIIASVPVHTDGTMAAENKYQFTDIVAKSSNTVYYRLNIKMPEGQRKYSDIRVIHLSPNAEVSIYPNPAKIGRAHV